MDDALERKLTPNWAPELVVLSYLISWLGAYTSTQIMIYAKYTRSTVLKWVWTFFASIAFGFCAIWAMHFVGMLACRLDVQIHFNILLTILSAVVAVGFTFAALASPYASEAIENSKPILALSKWHNGLYTSVTNIFTGRRLPDVEAGYAPLRTTDADEHSTVSAPEDQRPTDGDDLEASSDEEDEGPSNSAQPHPMTGQPTASTSGAQGPSRLPIGRHRASFEIFDSPRRPSVHFAHQPHHPISVHDPESTQSSSTTLSTPSTSDSSSLTRTLSGTTLNDSSSGSWGGPLRAGLSRETRLRIKARAKERPDPEFGWRYWMNVYYKAITPFLFIRAIIWAAAIVFMHYCGMWAMELPQGRIAWDMRIVALSYVVAFSVCFIGAMIMNNMESHLGRQMVFSTIAALGCCSMHYTGMAAATFYTYEAPSPHAGYPAFLPITIVGIAVMVCVVSNVVLSHVAVKARNKMAEMILTKRRLWRIMAEKEAAEQAMELKQQFISVASHEIRTPLHTVNGYCELLARADLTEEQSLYVNSIQQACHAINVIAGNVLDFSKLDRNNVELSARPVHMEIRKTAEDVAKITGASGVDVIVWVAKDVPHAVYLDETYTFRILMNLLSNAQKFCEQGYICLSVSMSGPAQMCIEVADTGCGIPQNFQSAIFEPFRQADTSITRPRQGTGLGLSIVKHLVQRMSGTIDVESIEGEGSRFIVRLPVQLPSRSPSPSVVFPVAPAVAVADPTRRVRVVYRDERTQDKYVRLWQKYGYVALPGSPLSSAKELLQDGVDTIWTDAETVAGSAGLRRLMGSLAKVPVALFIVHSNSQDLVPLGPQLNTVGRNVVLVKRPVILHKLLEAVEAGVEGASVGAHIRPESSTKVRFSLPEDEKPGQFSMLPTPMAEKEELQLYASVSTGAGVEVGGSAEENIPLSPVKSMTELTKPKVLLVEDNMINQRLGCRLLEKLGYEVVTANDGKEAIDAIRQTYFVCCLMDCQMPVLDGFRATREIRELEQNGALPDHLPIIALTANVTQESEGDCKAAGMDYFLPKPLRFPDLEGSLHRLRRTSEHGQPP